MVNVIKKLKVFLESVTKTVFYVRCTPSNSNVGPHTSKGHFTKVYSIKVCEPQNFPGFPWDPPIGFNCKRTVCILSNPITESQENFEVHKP